MPRSLGLSASMSTTEQPTSTASFAFPQTEATSVPRETSARFPADHSRYLTTNALRRDIGKRAVRGGLVTLISQHARAVIDIVAQLVLARLLVPEDFGLVAMVIALTRFAAMFIDMGLSTATVQREEVSQQQISVLFWINVILGGLLCVVFVAAAPLIAWLLAEPRLVGIITILASGLVFTGLTVQHQALLQRQMQFHTLALLGAVSVSLAAVVAIVTAWWGAAYWALVMMHLTYSFVMAVGVWATCSWRPDWSLHVSSVRQMLSFGRNLAGFDLLEYAASNIDKVLIGSTWGAMWVGLYARAFELFLTPIKQVSAPLGQVILPTLSRLQKEPHQFRAYYVNCLTLVMLLSTPLSTVIFIIAPELIELFLGERWTAAAKLVRCLIICGLFSPVVHSMQWICRATGKARRLLRLGVFSSALTVASILLGLPYGVEATALSYSICNVVLMLPYVHFATRQTPVSLWVVVRALAIPLVLSILAALPSLAVKVYLEPSWDKWDVLLLSIGTYTAVFGILVLAAIQGNPSLKATWQSLRNSRSSGND